MELNPEASGAETLIARFMTEGETLFEAGAYEEALSRWLKVLEIDPANESAMQNMAKAHEKLMGSPFKKVVSKESPSIQLPSPPPEEPARQPAAAPDVVRRAERRTDPIPRVEPRPPTPVRPSPAPAHAAPVTVPAPAAASAKQAMPPPPKAAPPAPAPEPPVAPPASAPAAPSARDSDRIERRDVVEDRADERVLEIHLKRYLKRGVDFFNSKDYDKAIVEWAKVLRERPLHEATLVYIRKARAKLDKIAMPERQREESEAFDRLSRHGDEYFGEGEYRMAINQYVQALTYRPDESGILDKVRQAEQALKRMGDSASPATGIPRSLRHMESPLATSQSGAFVKSKEESERLTAAARNIYSQILKEESGQAAPSKKQGGRVVAMRPAASSGPAGARFVGVKVAVIIIGLAFIGWQVWNAYLKPNRELLDLGRRQLDAALHSEAVDSLTRHIERNREDPEGYAVRAQAYEALKDFDAAVEDRKKVVELTPQDPQALELYAESLMKAEDYPMAAKAFEVAIPMLDATRQEEALDHLITVYINGGDPQRAAATCDKLLEKITAKDKRLEVLQVKGELLLSMNRFADGRKTLEQVHDEGGKDPSLFARIYRSYLIEGDMAGAKRAIERALAELPDAPELHFMSAKVTHLGGDLEGAIAEIDRGLKVDEAHWRGYAELASIWMREFQRRKDEDTGQRALNALEASKDRARIDGRLSFVEAVALMMTGREGEADLKLEESIRHLDPGQTDDVGFSFLAMAKLMRKDYAGALDAIQKALATEPFGVAHWVLKGNAQLESGDAPGAGQSYLKSFEVQPEDKKILLPTESMLQDRQDLEGKMRLAGLKLEREPAQKLQGYLDKAR